MIVRLLVILILLAGSAPFLSMTAEAEDENIKAHKFNLLETTIADVHKAILAGELSCEELTRQYIERIEVFDQSTGLNSIIMINPEAMMQARGLDQQFAKSGRLQALHCVPVIVKDNYNTRDLQTTAGSAAMLGFLPDNDAWIVAKLKAAGALVLAKSNMAEWAFSPRMTISSVAGETRNPYNLDHVPAGSSGGTGAAIAANLGLVGLGTDTGNSIRGPSSHNGLVGIRATLGATSRTGIVPLYFRNDVGGPMTRTVEDAVRVFQVIAGPDPADAMTAYSKGKIPTNLLQSLDKNALEGVRIGVLRQLSERDHDPAIAVLFSQAIRDLQSMGATMVETIEVKDFDTVSANHWCRMFQHDLNQYLAENKDRVPMHSLKEIVESGKYSDEIAEDLKAMLAVVDPRKDGAECEDIYHDTRRLAFRHAVVEAMDEARVSALIYPSWNFPPGRIGHPEDYKGDNNQVIAPHTGLPAVTVPMGFVRGLPAGLQFLGRLYSEADILPLVYAYEQGTEHRIPPPGFGQLSLH